MVPNTLNFMITIHGIMLEQPTFKGTPGVSYRVTLTVYARNSKGSDTGYITSYTVVCR